MAKIDIRFQFNEQCFLISNPGVVHRAVQLMRTPITKESQKRYTATRKSISKAQSTHKSAAPGKHTVSVEDDLASAEHKSAMAGVLYEGDNFVYYLDKKATGVHTANGARSDPGYLFHNFFDNYAKYSYTHLLGDPTPSIDFHFYKSYPVGNSQTYEQVEIPFSTAFSHVKYRDTNDNSLRNQFNTRLGDAQIEHLSLSYSGKDFAHSNVVECEIDIKVDSLQSLLRRFKAPGSKRYVSISDLMRMPSKNINESKASMAGQAWAIASTNLQSLAPSQVQNMTNQQLSDYFGGVVVDDATKMRLTKPGFKFSAESVKKAFGKKSQATERYFYNSIMQNNYAQKDANCPVAPEDNAKAKMQPNPDFFQIKVEWGYTKDADHNDVITNPLAAKALRQSVHLNLLSYEIDYMPEGAILLKLKYIGRAEKALDGVNANLINLHPDEETTIEKMRQIGDIFKGLKSTLETQGGASNVKQQTEKAAALLLSIPGIKSNNANAKTILRPLWRDKSTVDATTEKGTLALNAFQEDLTSHEYYNKLAGFMENSIDHFLSMTRAARYGRLFNTLLFQSRMYFVQVPYEYLGYGETGAESLKAAATWNSKSKARHQDNDDTKKAVKQIKKAVAENQANAGQNRALVDNAGILSSDPNAKSLTDSQKDIINSVKIIGRIGPGGGNFGTGGPNKDRIGYFDSGAKNGVHRAQKQLKKRLNKQKSVNSDEKRESSSEMHKKIYIEGDGISRSRWWRGSDAESSDNIMMSGQELNEEGLRRVSFTTLGHILEVACSTAGFHGISEQFKGTDWQGTIGNLPDIRIVLAPLDIGGTYLQDGANKGAIEASAQQIMNIGDIPVAMTLFQQFWQEKVVQRGREVYTLGEFLKELITFFMAHTFGSDCNVFNRVRSTIVDLDYVTSYAHITQASHIDDVVCSWPSRWKTPMTVDQLNSVYANQEPHTGGQISIRRGAQVGDKPIIYLILRVKNFSLEYLDPMTVLTGKKGGYGIPIFSPPKHGTNTTGKMQDLKFKRAEAKFVREARLAQGNNFHSDMIRDVYDVEARTLGIPTFRPGNIIYVDPTMENIGEFPGDPIVTHSTINNTLGLGGFYVVTEVRHDLIGGLEEKYFTTLVCRFNTFGGCLPFPINMEASTIKNKGVLASVSDISKRDDRIAQKARTKALVDSARRCFVAGTKVNILNDDGEIKLTNIENIKVNDLVLSWDEKALEIRPNPVIKTIHDPIGQSLLRIFVDGLSKPIDVTYFHPFYLDSKKDVWVPAKDLSPGDMLTRYIPELNKTMKVPIKSIEKLEHSEPTYNLEVGNHPSFLVDGVIVHNKRL